MASFKEIRELLLFSVENNTINEAEFFLLSKGSKSVNRLSNEKAWIKSNRTVLVLLSYTFYRSYCWRQDFRTVPFIYLLRIYDSIHVDQVYRKQHTRNMWKSCFREADMYISKHINKQKQCGWDCRCFERFSLGFLTGFFHARVPSINAFFFFQLNSASGNGLQFRSI